MLTNKTQDYFLNNLIGCFYKNYLILDVKASNFSFILDVIEIWGSALTTLKEPKKIKIKVDYSEIRHHLQDTKRYQLIINDMATIYQHVGIEQGFLNNIEEPMCLKSADLQQLLDEAKPELIDLFAYLTKLRSMVAFSPGQPNMGTITIKPFQYALNLDDLLATPAAQLYIPNLSSKAIEACIEANWFDWSPVSKLMPHQNYDVVLLNSIYMAIVRVHHGAVKAAVSKLTVNEGVICSTICDLGTVDIFLKEKIAELGYSILSLEPSPFDFISTSYDTWLTPQALKSLPILKNLGIDKTLKKYLDKTHALNDQLDLLHNTVQSKETVLSTMWGTPYIHQLEAHLSGEFHKLLCDLRHHGFSLDMLKVANTLSKGAIQEKLSHAFTTLGLLNLSDVHPKLLAELVAICQNHQAQSDDIDQDMLNSVFELTTNAKLRPMVVFKQEQQIYLAYEPEAADHRLVPYEWYSLALYHEDDRIFRPEPSWVDQHKSSLVSLLANADVLHIFDNQVLSGHYPNVFATPAEKTSAFSLCLDQVQFNESLQVLVTNNSTPGYFENLINSFKDSNKNQRNSKLGIFLITNLELNSCNYAYSGIFIEIDKNSTLDLSNTYTKTIDSDLIPQNYLIFKRLIAV